MKTILTTVLLASGLLMAGSASAMASPKNMDAKTLPVLVQVDSNGKVTSATPAPSLEPGMAKAMRNAINAMITRPAMSHGQPVPSQFILVLKVTPTGAQGGQYRFDYAGTRSVPIGRYHWIQRKDQPGDRDYALVSDQRYLGNVDGPQATEPRALMPLIVMRPQHSAPHWLMHGDN